MITPFKSLCFICKSCEKGFKLIWYLVLILWFYEINWNIPYSNLYYLLVLVLTVSSIYSICFNRTPSKYSTVMGHPMRTHHTRCIRRSCNRIRCSVDKQPCEAINGQLWNAAGQVIVTVASFSFTSSQVQVVACMLNVGTTDDAVNAKRSATTSDIQCWTLGNRSFGQSSNWGLSMLILINYWRGASARK